MVVSLIGGGWGPRTFGSHLTVTGPGSNPDILRPEENRKIQISRTRYLFITGMMFVMYVSGNSFPAMAYLEIPNIGFIP
jgi:hypothetical protein